MREELNCPNCGAPIRSVECPYCGTTFFDFAEIKDDAPTYIRLKVQKQNIAFRAKMNSVMIEFHEDNVLYENEKPMIVGRTATANIEFDLYPDDDGVLLCRRGTNYETD